MIPLATYLCDSIPAVPPILWHLLANRNVQRTRTSCSVASLSIALNALTSVHCRGVVEQTLDEDKVLARMTMDKLRQNLSQGTGGATLNEAAEIAVETLAGLELLDPSVTAHHIDEPNETYTEIFRGDLAGSTGGSSVIIVNYHQGVATGRDLSHGHFAPAAPVTPEARQVCVVDPARDGAPFVLDAEHLVRAMATRDKDSGRNRGYLKIALGS
ncbi:MAG: phytochelatin synthase family protein [Candidatus Obscuribacterales bacterium]